MDYVDKIFGLHSIIQVKLNDLDSDLLFFLSMHRTFIDLDTCT